jgi:hypothetical protein
MVKQQLRTPEQERFVETLRIGLLTEEFMLPKVVRAGMFDVLFEARNRPEDFWRVARMLRRRIVRRNVVVSQWWAEKEKEAEEG